MSAPAPEVTKSRAAEALEQITLLRAGLPDLRPEYPALARWLTQVLDAAEQTLWRHRVATNPEGKTFCAVCDDWTPCPDVLAVLDIYAPPDDVLEVIGRGA